MQFVIKPTLEYICASIMYIRDVRHQFVSILGDFDDFEKFFKNDFRGESYLRNFVPLLADTLL